MSKKKKIIITFIVLIIAAVTLIFILSFNYKKDAFSLDEKKWIDENKNKVIDISILNEIPILSYNGKGLIFDLLSDIEKETGLTFNTNAYKITENKSNNYNFKLVNKKSKNDILVLRDNYVLVLKDNMTFSTLEDINNLNIGLLKEDFDTIKSMLNETNNLTSYDDTNTLISSLNSEENSIDGVIILKTLITEELIKNDLTISYQFDGITKDYVISLNGDEILNSILKKSLKNWKKDNFKDVYNDCLLKQYFEFNNIKDSEQTNIKSKKYVYGFVENGIYDYFKSSKLRGINNLILKDFSNFSDISITYKKYNNIENMLEDYKNGKIDIFLNNTKFDTFDIDSKITKSGIDSQLVVISKAKNNVVIDSLYAIKNYKFATIESSQIEKYLFDNNIKYEKYSNINSLLKNIKDDELVLLDIENYNYYKNTYLNDYKIDYITNIINNYKYVINNKENNFSNLFSFYSNYISLDKIISEDYDSISYKTVNYYTILVIVIVLLLIALVLISINKIKIFIKSQKKKRRINLSKNDKLKYIDQLTSLKNRAYLNSKIDSWDNSEIYPQAIIIIDLNNISYINDNYGREEGDSVIIEAASILINSQLPNSEIIRTDGDEFLIYLVGYSEKNVISYLRSISRELKKLSHGFGAASGYSIITDKIKTIDDAVNEATLDMKNNKEDIEY